MKKLFAILVALTMLSVFPMASGASSDVELVAAWDFDTLNPDGTIPDITGNGNILTLSHDKYTHVTGFSGKAFNFSSQGSSGYDNYSKHMVADSDPIAEAINGASAVTFTAMMKKQVKGSATNFCMFALNAGSNSVLAFAKPYEMQFNARSDYASKVMSVKAATIYPNIDDSTSPDGWMHLALVVDYANDAIKVYADGVLVGYQKEAAAAQAFATDVASYKTDVGDISTGYFGVGGRHVLIDDMKIYRGALSEAEIMRSVPSAMSYDFESAENNIVKDACVGKMDMTVTDATVVPGVVGNTLKLTAPATLPVAAHRGMLYGAYEQSVSFWLKLSNGQLPASTQTIFKDAGKDGFRIELTPNGAVSVGGRSADADSYRSVTSPDNIFLAGDTSWHHIYAELDYRAKKGRIYVNGYLVKEADLAFSTGYYNMTGLGSSGDVLDLSSDASLLMDELRFDRRKLSLEEIREQVAALPMVSASFSKTVESVTALCDVVNTTAGTIYENDMTLILAAYDQQTNRLVNATYLNLPQIPKYSGLTGVTLTIPNMTAPENYTYKVYTWYGLGSVSSYCDELIYTFGE